MKILLATYWLIPHVGGVWKFMTQIKERLEAMGHEVDLLGNSPDYSRFHIWNRGMELPKAGLQPLLAAKLDAEHAPLLHGDPLIDFYERDRYLMELSAAYFGLESYDLIHTQDIFSARALSRVKPAHIPLIAHLHGSVATELRNHFRSNPQLNINEDSPAWKYFESIEHYGAMSGNLTITANHAQRNMLIREFGVPASRVAAFQYGLDMDQFWRKAGEGTSLRRPSGKKVIIFPARLAAVKGINVLISALGLLKCKRRDWVCWIVGDGEQRTELENQAAGLQLQEDVLFLGERSDVPALLLNSDIFVHSCIQDNQPFSVMEAQIAGLAVCVSSAGGLPEMVEHGRTGLISPVNNPLVLSEQLNILLENEVSRKELGRNAQAWGSVHWSLDAMISRLLSIYNLALYNPIGRYE
ncbi:glycosyltransferase family 4 protein [Paenibacillus sp. M1]|uniref:Glycosyltransferase family 4 protein n=1 Tax=Paenibacillus haidiansis TaxID=1574488 RepID=A0ABU7VX32_9BACL